MAREKVWLATALLGSSVRNRAGVEMGRIEELVVDSATGCILYAAISMRAVPELFAVPWSLISSSPSGDYIVVNTERHTLEGAPGFDPGRWPDITDPVWRNRVNEYYGITPAVPVRDRQVYVDRRPVAPRRGLSALGIIFLVLLVAGLCWTAYLVSTRGWEQAKNDAVSSVQGAAYAMKETSEGAALTGKVKTALALSKRIPSDRINVDAQDGVVTLRGTVDSEEIRELAERIALDTRGVEAVQNQLYVTGGSK